MYPAERGGEVYEKVYEKGYDVDDGYERAYPAERAVEKRYASSGGRGRGGGGGGGVAYEDERVVYVEKPRLVYSGGYEDEVVERRGGGAYGGSRGGGAVAYEEAEYEGGQSLRLMSVGIVWTPC